jgi:predicted nuclease of predicted toxin-antitoxin system
MKPGHSRILTDENVSPRVVAFLRTNGYDVSDIKELGLFGLPDREVLARAHAEQRIVITHDADFGMLAINQGIPFTSIIYIRLGFLVCVRIPGTPQSLYGLLWPYPLERRQIQARMTAGTIR